jgi:hypothetical protein
VQADIIVVPKREQFEKTITGLILPGKVRLRRGGGNIAFPTTLIRNIQHCCINFLMDTPAGAPLRTAFGRVTWKKDKYEWYHHGLEVWEC